MTRRGAIAIFVKTPERSPVKTRLAGTIGDDRARQMYRLCLSATQATVVRACQTVSLDPYWAIAEAEAMDDPLWSSFARIAQGSGGLGERLDRVYRTLLDRHPFVTLIGADAPLLPASLIVKVAEMMRSKNAASFAISRSLDGGYALFAGRLPLPLDLWISVPYSAETTADAFVARLRAYCDVAELDPCNDVDEFADLARLIADAAVGDLHSEQREVVEYARRLMGDASGDG